MKVRLADAKKGTPSNAWCSFCFYSWTGFLEAGRWWWRHTRMPFVRFHVFVHRFGLCPLIGCQYGIDLGHRSEVLNHQVCLELCLLIRKSSHLSFVKLPVRGGSADLF